MLKSSRPMPVPIAWISVPTSFDDSIRSKRARSTLRILPLSGRIACVLRSRPCLAEPPAESPSTRKSSDLAGSRSWQSASLPGSEAMLHHALAACQFARLLGGFARGGGVDHLLDDRLGVRRIFLEPFGQLVRHQAFERLAHLGRDELVLGLDPNFGSGSLTETIAVSPSRMSSPVRLTFSLLQHAGLSRHNC
jgi:hypothetical protein